MICKREGAGGLRYSLSCNPDTGPEVIRLLEKHGRPHVVIGQVNQNLPYFGHDAEVAPDRFDFVVDHTSYTSALFYTHKINRQIAVYGTRGNERVELGCRRLSNYKTRH